MVAQHCESIDGSWKCWQEFTMRSKFKGKYLEVEPLGIAHLVKIQQCFSKMCLPTKISFRNSLTLEIITLGGKSKQSCTTL